MLTAAKMAFKAASGAGLLPAFGWALVLVAAIAASTAGWAVHRWDKGAQAIAEDVKLKAQHAADVKAYSDLLANAKALQQTQVDNALATRQAFERMDAIANHLEQSLEHNHAFAAQQQQQLAQLLARRPDLRNQHLGTDVLQHWNQSNQGAGGAAIPATGPAGQPAHAMPTAPRGSQRPDAGTAGQPRRGGGAVSRLQRSQHIARVSGRRVAGHRMALVLQRGGSARPRWVGVSSA